MPRNTWCRSASNIFRATFGATIQEQTVREENVHFPLPRSLRELLPAGAPLPMVPGGTNSMENSWSMDQVD